MGNYIKNYKNEELYGHIVTITLNMISVQTQIYTNVTTTTKEVEEAIRSTYMEMVSDSNNLKQITIGHILHEVYEKYDWQSGMVMSDAYVNLDK